MMQNPYSQDLESLCKASGVALPHFVEWLNSHVSPDFINANVRSLEGEEAFEKIAGAAVRAAGESANQAANSRLFKVNKAHSNLHAGGWWVSGLDPLNNFAPMDWGQLKPNQPKWDAKKQRPRKYEAPAKTPVRLFLPAIPWPVAEGIINRYNASAPPQEQIPEADSEALKVALEWGGEEQTGAFWPFFLAHPKLPLIITEGAKKTGAACCAGFAAIGLPGIWNGRKPLKKDAEGKKIEGQKAFLKDELLAFAQQGRRIIFGFDNDESIKTQMAVWRATEATAFLFLRDTRAVPAFTSWSHEEGKGIDDFIAANGAEAFAEQVAEAKGYEEWKIGLQIGRKLSRKPDLRIEQKLLNIDFSKLPQSGIIGIASPKGSGKTQHFLKPLAEEEKSVLLIGHLINLTKANSQRMACTYRTDLDRAAGRFIGSDGEPVYRVSTVIDSLLSFNPRDFEGSMIIIDEVCQLLRSALTSKNIGSRGNRGAILTRLRQIIQNARLVVVADADLNDWALDYLEALRGNDEPAFLIKNEYVPEGYEVSSFEGSGPAAIVADVLDKYEAELKKGTDGKHVFVALDSKGKAAVAARMARDASNLPGAEVIEIHSETSGGELESEFIRNPDQYLSYLDNPALVVFSPSWGSASVAATKCNKGYFVA